MRYILNGRRTGRRQVPVDKRIVDAVKVVQLPLKVSWIDFAAIGCLDQTLPAMPVAAVPILGGNDENEVAEEA